MPRSQSLMQKGKAFANGAGEEKNLRNMCPKGGWARLESLEKPYWKVFEPEKVLIPALEFSEKPEGFKASIWFPALPQNTYLLGLKIKQSGRDFTYVVTIPPKFVYFGDIDRLPVLVRPDFSLVEHNEPYFDVQPSLF